MKTNLATVLSIAALLCSAACTDGMPDSTSEPGASKADEADTCGIPFDREERRLFRCGFRTDKEFFFEVWGPVGLNLNGQARGDGPIDEIREAGYTTDPVAPPTINTTVHVSPIELSGTAGKAYEFVFGQTATRMVSVPGVALEAVQVDVTGGESVQERLLCDNMDGNTAP
jgi:hypothetical protein